MTSNERPAGKHETASEERAFAEYLRRHPDFFQRHASLLSQLVIPHPTSGQAVSLLERQVIALRDQHDATQRKLNELVRNARENDRLNRRMEELTLYLLSQRSLAEFLEHLPRRLKKIFDLEYVTLRLESERGAPAIAAGIDDAHLAPILTPDERRWLFTDVGDDIESCALLPIKLGPDQRRYALLAIGSGDRKRYHPDSGTHYLRQIQRLLSASVTQLASLTAP